MSWWAGPGVPGHVTGAGPSTSCCPALGLKDGIEFRLRLDAWVFAFGSALLDRYALRDPLPLVALPELIPG